jgi:glutamate-1-semialdehyde 2,1-aminomutase
VTRQTDRSAAAFARSQQVIPGGVNSPVRAFRSVGGTPVFFDRGAGPSVTDIDGNAYIDYVLSWGPLILGHAHPEVVERTTQALQKGTSFGAPTEAETELAEIIIRRVPGIDQIRLVNSGTEATMSALRLARAATGRHKIVKFAGCYHGHADFLLVQAGSGVATLGLPDSPGVPPGTTADTLVARFNDIESVQSLFDANRDEIAAVIIEPVAGNMGLVLPRPGFHEDLRRVTREHGALLVIDEVMTGFRVHPAGAVALYGIDADLVTFGKVVGGGFPLAAYAGKADVMGNVAPAGAMYQAGTLSGNPVATAAGIATLDILGRDGEWEKAASAARSLAVGIGERARKHGIPVEISQVGSMFGMFFTDQPVADYDDAKRSDTARYSAYFQALLDRGVYMAPSQFETGFTSTVHDAATIDATLAAIDEVFATLA